MTDPSKAFRAATLAVLGYAPEVIVPGVLHRFPTSSRRGDVSGWCKLFPDGRAGVFGDWRAGVTETWTAGDRRAMTRGERLEVARQVADASARRERDRRAGWAEQAVRMTGLWAKCVPPVPGDPVTLYLERRGFGGVWPLPVCLRLHPALAYWDGQRKLGSFPAMVAPLIAPDGRIVALHRTFLQADGRKADVPTVKKLTPAAGPVAGAYIPLHAPQHQVIGVAEGIETALAAHCAAAVPTVAAYSAGGLASWRWPAGVRRVVIYADNDEAGQHAAQALCVRLRAAGVAHEVHLPSVAGADWCDVWAAGRLLESVAEGANA